MIWFALGWIHGFACAVWLMGWVNAAPPETGDGVDAPVAPPTIADEADEYVRRLR